jgi:hypothetical protein
MTKKLVIVAALMTTFCGNVFAQDGSGEENASEGGGFLSGIALKTNNKFQVSLMLGNAGLFNQDLNYLRPHYSDPNLGIQAEIGAPEQKSGDPGMYLELNNLGEGSIVNMAGLSFAYYITEGLDVNLSFGMDLRSTPKKDYVENENANGMNIQGAKWMQGRVQNNWILSAGSNYHFKVTNEKIDLYGGVKVGYQHGQLTVTTPYTDYEYGYLYGNGLNNGDVSNVHGTADPYQHNATGGSSTSPSPSYDDDGNYIDPVVNAGEITKPGANGVNKAGDNPQIDAQNQAGLGVDAKIYSPRSGAGQINCITASLLVGVSYNLGGGLSLGIEFEPYAYRYSMLEVCPKGARVYQAAHYANRFFASPMLKLGFRF